MGGDSLSVMLIYMFQGILIYEVLFFFEYVLIFIELQLISTQTLYELSRQVTGQCDV
jgi:hypothetical protein